MLVGFALLSLHLLREQIVAQSIKNADCSHLIRATIMQDPRKVPEQLRVRRAPSTRATALSPPAR